MGIAHKIISACLRVLELGCTAIILGILAKLFYALDQVNGPTDPRLVYAISLAAISVVVSMVLLPPLRYSFYCFPLDLALFVCWIVCFALLEDLTGTKTCSTTWYDSNWLIYWSTDSGNTAVVTGSACSRWRVVLAFSFIVSMTWFISGLLSLYACATYHELGTRTVAVARKITWWKKPKEGDLEKSTEQPSQDQRLPLVGQNGVEQREEP